MINQFLLQWLIKNQYLELKMKNLVELLEATQEELPKIYCDLDQVLVNFMKGADAAVGGSFVDSDRATRWDKINQVKGYWEKLEWMPGSKRLYQFIAKYAILYQFM